MEPAILPLYQQLHVVYTTSTPMLRVVDTNTISQIWPSHLLSTLDRACQDTPYEETLQGEEDNEG